MLAILGLTYAGISLVAAIFTVALMRGRDWNVFAAIGAGVCWPIWLYIGLRKDKTPDACKER